MADRIKSCDSGSLPSDKLTKLNEGAEHFIKQTHDDSTKFFEKKIVRSLIDKINTGISIPAIPQFRDMNEMFLSILEGIKKTEKGYIETGNLTLNKSLCKIPEVQVVKQNAKQIQDHVGEPFQIKNYVTGPYTLASFFAYRNSDIYEKIGLLLGKIVDSNLFSVKAGKITLLSIDEPLFGMVDDPVMDRESPARETLLKTWELIAKKAKSKKVRTCIHLHSTSDDLFWNVESIAILESHVGDPLYEMKSTKLKLEKYDKQLKASIAKTTFDHLIQRTITQENFYETIAKTWKLITQGELNPVNFLEDTSIMRKRLEKIVKRFSIEKVPLAGPECGLRGFPNYDTALECLKRVSEAVREK